MSEPNVHFGTEAREELADGLDALANVVRITLGPRGRHVLLDRGPGSPIITKDGVTVARELELPDHFANMGVQMVKEVASKTSDEAGDGTTTATVLAQAIYHEGAKLVAAGIDPGEIRRGIEAAVEAIVADLVRQSRPVAGRADITHVGSVSANGDVEIGTMIAEAMERVGTRGALTAEATHSLDTYVEYVEGMAFDRGYLSPYFITDQARLEAVLEDVAILVHATPVTDFLSLLPLLSAAIEANKSLLIIAADVDHATLAPLVVNSLRGALRICAVKAPGFGDSQVELLEDIAAVTGTTVLSPLRGDTLKHATLDELGAARRVVVSADSTTIIGAGGTADGVAVRVALLEARLADESDGPAKSALEERLATLGGVVAVIHIGAPTPTELAEKSARFDDALRATRAATEEGVVPGGGVALLRALDCLDQVDCPGEQRYGVDVVRRAVQQPLRQMALNAGVDPSVVVHEVLRGRGSFGYNVADERYEDLVATGIIDPAKVVRVALQSAASIASLMLSSEVAVLTPE